MNSIAREDLDHDDTEGYEFEPISPSPTSTKPTAFPPPTISPSHGQPERPIELGGKSAKRRTQPSAVAARKNRSKQQRRVQRAKEKNERPYGACYARERSKSHHVAKAKSVKTTLNTRKL